MKNIKMFAYRLVIKLTSAKNIVMILATVFLRTGDLDSSQWVIIAIAWAGFNVAQKFAKNKTSGEGK